MIKANSLSRSYADLVAVDKISFEIESQSIVGLLGHNGAGKTTIMKMLTGYLEPSSGSVTVDGADLWQNLREIQLQIGYLPENSPLYPEMSVIDYLDYAATLRGVPKSLRLERIAYAVERTNILDVAEKTVATLSRGYKQRLGVAQAILNSPRILILDEPTNGLDPSQILEMRSLIKELSKTATIVLSTHILQEVQAVCSRVIIINRGKLAQDAELSTLQNTGRIQLFSSADPQALDMILAQLKALKVASSTREEGEYKYALQALPEENVQELSWKLNKLLVDSGHRVYSIQAELRDLESIFGEINSGGAEASVN